jgi:hypothetical protein
MATQRNASELIDHQPYDASHEVVAAVEQRCTFDNPKLALGTVGLSDEEGCDSEKYRPEGRLTAHVCTDHLKL